MSQHCNFGSHDWEDGECIECGMSKEVFDAACRERCNQAGHVFRSMEKGKRGTNPEEACARCGTLRKDVTTYVCPICGNVGTSSIGKSSYGCDCQA